MRKELSAQYGPVPMLAESGGVPQIPRNSCTTPDHQTVLRSGVPVQSAGDLTTPASGNDNRHRFLNSKYATQETSLMGGPIVRTGTTPAFWENWDKAFGKASKASSKATVK